MKKKRAVLKPWPIDRKGKGKKSLASKRGFGSGPQTADTGKGGKSRGVQLIKSAGARGKRGGRQFFSGKRKRKKMGNSILPKSLTKREKRDMTRGGKKGKKIPYCSLYLGGGEGEHSNCRESRSWVRERKKKGKKRKLSPCAVKAVEEKGKKKRLFSLGEGERANARWAPARRGGGGGRSPLEFCRER